MKTYKNVCCVVFSVLGIVLFCLGRTVWGIVSFAVAWAFVYKDIDRHFKGHQCIFPSTIPIIIALTMMLRLVLCAVIGTTSQIHTKKETH